MCCESGRMLKPSQIFRSLVSFTFILSVAAFAAPVLAQTADESPAAVRGTQLERQRALLQRLGTRLTDLNREIQLVDQLADLLTVEQLEALKRFQLQPSQALDLLKLVQDNTPPGGLTRQNWPEVRKKISTKMEDILGSSQFDNLQELIPSPQQFDRASAILKSALATPKGQAVMAATTELKASLTAQQLHALSPVLDQLDQVNPASPPQQAKKFPPKPFKNQRYLTQLRRDSLGEVYAEIFPDFDFQAYLPQRYKVVGADPDLLRALSSSSGLPVRILGHLEEDLLVVAQQSLIGPPALQAVEGGRAVWHGSCPAQLVSNSPALVRFELKPGQFHEAQVDLQTPAENSDFQKFAKSQQPFRFIATAILPSATQPSGRIQLVDSRFEPAAASPTVASSAIQLQLLEEGLQFAADQYLAAHADKWSGKTESGDTKISVSKVGLTLLDCGGEPNRCRFFGTIAVEASGLRCLEASFSFVARANLQGTKFSLVPVADTLQIHTHEPFQNAAPAAWTRRIEAIMGPEYAKGFSLEAPPKLRDELLKYGVVDQKQLDQSQIITYSADDRRRNWVAALIPQPGPPGATSDHVLRPNHGALAVSGETINQVIKKNLPALPFKKPVPEHLRKQDGASLNEIEVTELDVTFENGLLQIKRCALNVHWSFALFSGVEPGIRFSATAKLGLKPGTEEDPNPKLTANLQIQSLDFLSPRILSGSPEEQKSQKEKLIKTMNETPLELPAPTFFELTGLSPKARLQLTDIQHVEQPSQIRFQGQLIP